MLLSITNILYIIMQKQVDDLSQSVNIGTVSTELPREGRKSSMPVLMRSTRAAKSYGYVGASYAN